MVGLPLGGLASLFTWVAPLVGLPVGPEDGLLVGRQHLGAARPTTLVGRVVGLPLCGPAGLFAWVAPFVGLPVGPEVILLINRQHLGAAHS
jgi:hypothetical protein